MTVLVNGENREVPPHSTVDELLQILDLQQPRIAVAVNSNVLPRSTFGTHQLTDGDKIEILHAVGGG